MGSLWCTCPHNHITVGKQAHHKMLPLRPWERRQLHPKHYVIYRKVERDLLYYVVTCLRYDHLVQWTVGTTVEKSNGNRLHPELACQPYTSSFVRAAEVAGSRLAFFQRRSLKTTFRNAVPALRLFDMRICTAVTALVRTSQRHAYIVWVPHLAKTASAQTRSRSVLSIDIHVFHPDVRQNCGRTFWNDSVTECVRHYVQQCLTVGLVLTGRTQLEMWVTRRKM